MPLQRALARALLLGVPFAALVAAGCAGGAASPVYQPPAALFPASYARPGIADAPLSRLIDGRLPPTGSACTPSAAIAKVRTSASNAGTLFVTEYTSAKAPVEEYDASGNNPDPIGSIVAAVTHAWGASVDTSGNVAVADFNKNVVYVFPQGATEPSETLTDGVLWPLDTGTDQQGDLYVVNGYGGPILVFPPGATQPSMQLTGFYYPTQMAFDTRGNMYVVDELYGTHSPLGAVFKFASGSTSGTNLGLKHLDYPVGLAIDSHNNVAVSNLGDGTVNIYGPGETTIKRTLTSGVCNPVFLAFNAAGALFVVENGTPPNGAVTGYAVSAHTPFVTLQDGMANPRGIALNPNWQP